MSKKIYKQLIKDISTDEKDANSNVDVNTVTEKDHIPIGTDHEEIIIVGGKNSIPTGTDHEAPTIVGEPSAVNVNSTEILTEDDIDPPNIQADNIRKGDNRTHTREDLDVVLETQLNVFINSHDGTPESEHVRVTEGVNGAVSMALLGSRKKLLGALLMKP